MAKNHFFFIKKKGQPSNTILAKKVIFWAKMDFFGTFRSKF